MKSIKRSAKTQKGTLLLVAIIALIALSGVLEAKRQVVENQLEQVTVRLEQMQTGSTRQDREKAARIVNKVKRLMEVGDIEPTVATIVDVDKLRERNPFYNKAENGDFLIVTAERAILFSEKRNKILDVVPVQVAPAATSQ
ncbi:MAG: hypothetical protein QF400_04425 [Candidatus Peribacteraceae bacterium]|jgi:hypothetical protein|nr:hypothetical protein [Candidatus Peribacteraceae bacterium]